MLDSGIVDEDIDRASFPDGAVDRSCVGDIEDDTRNVSAISAERLGGL